MDYNRSDRLPDRADDRVVFYIEDLSSETSPNSALNFQGPGGETRGLYPPETQKYPQRSSSVYSQSGRPRRSRTIVGAEGHGGSRRASVHGGRSRANSCNGPTPLGDGRRASVCRKNRPRRGSTVRRKDSVQPGKTAAVNLPKAPISPVENPGGIGQDRNRRKIVMIVLAIFIFLLAAAVLVVVITLTHSSFHRLPNDPANHLEAHQDNQLRKENEELFNSLNRDSSVPDNTTAALP